MLSAYEQLMTPDEREKQRRFYFERHRHTCLVTRALCRTTLSRYARIDPRDWRFDENRYGRPHIRPGLCDRPIRFNLAHTEGLIACAVTLDREVGVDVEFIHRRGETVTLADRYFSASEVRDLHAVPAPEQRERFFHYWTLKESYIKARGLGLQVPLQQFSFHLLDESPIQISFDPKLSDNPNRWQFRLLRPTRRHVLALGVNHPRDQELAVSVAWTTPLGD